MCLLFIDANLRKYLDCFLHTTLFIEKCCVQKAFFEQWQSWHGYRVVIR